MMEKDGASIAFVVAAGMSFFNYCRTFQVVLLIHCEPWIR